jgi:hypothetical protein
MKIMKLLIALALSGCVGHIYVDESADSSAGVPDEPIACDEPKDCPEDTHCLDWRCDAHVCTPIPIGNPECRDAGGAP